MSHTIKLCWNKYKKEDLEEKKIGNGSNGKRGKEKMLASSASIQQQNSITIIES